MTRTQRDALTMLSRALTLCTSSGVDVAGMGAIGGQMFRLDQIDPLLINNPRFVGEKELGSAKRKAIGGMLEWTFWPWGKAGAPICWTGQATRTWWDGPAHKRDIQLIERCGRMFRLDFVTGVVYEVFV